MAMAATATKASVITRTLARWDLKDFRCIRSWSVAQNNFRGLDAFGILQAHEIGAAANPFEDDDLCQRGIRRRVKGHGRTADGSALEKRKVNGDAAFEHRTALA